MKQVKVLVTLDVNDDADPEECLFDVGTALAAQSGALTELWSAELLVLPALRLVEPQRGGDE